jgi:hypothetical protein
MMRNWAGVKWQCEFGKLRKKKRGGGRKEGGLRDFVAVSTIIHTYPIKDGKKAESGGGGAFLSRAAICRQVVLFLPQRYPIKVRHGDDEFLGKGHE